ncbi:PorP/SprF family type IX secretion system membrane protein [Hyunsoonleella ulvae]|uniref:PorP/SprF family type IX secretion system membrane protein n=1 Tax=Hyunsoonleella ulvae TaxID=2799948 RepID=UPI001939C2D6|nr:PorP/SprF family type IX secretion system membrane protein [Hyunsoonleella ulvae]
MNKYLLYMFLAICSIQQFHSQESNGIVALALPVRNSLKFNRYAINPTFSFVREQNKYISFTNKRQWAQFSDAPQSYLFSYSGRFSENIGAGVGLFQQNFGVLTTFGGILNFAYNANIGRESNLTFGLNIGAYQSGLNQGRVVVNTPDPSLQNVPSNFLITVNPGINYGTDFFDFGVSINNLVSYNLSESQIIEENPEQGLQAHVMYTGYMNSRGFFDNSRFSTLIRSEFKKDQTVISGLAMLNIPKGVWAQAGYNTLYGASVGVGINVTNNIAIEYNYEQSMGDFSEFGSSHEITLAYRFNKNYRYNYGDDDEEQSVFNSTKKRRKRNNLTDEDRARIAERRARIAAERLEEAKAKEEQADAKIEQSEVSEVKKVENSNTNVAKDEIKEKTVIDEQEKLQQELERQRKLEEARLKAEEEKRLREEQERKRIIEEEARKKKEAERLKAEAMARAKAEAIEKAKIEEARLKLEAEKKAEEERKLREEQERKRIIEEAARKKEEAERLEAEAIAKAKAEAIEKAKIEEEKRKALEVEQLQQEAERKRKEEEARLKLEAEENDETIIEQEDIPVANDEASKTMNALVSETNAAKKTQDELMKRFSEKIAIKQKDLDDLKEENDLSEKGIYLEPKPFKSLTEENQELEKIKDEIDKTLEEQKIKIIELETMYLKRKRKVRDKNDPVNEFYQNALERLKSEQEHLLSAKRDLILNLEQIKEATDFERKRRIRRAAYDNQQDRYNKDKATLARIKKFTDERAVPLQEEDFDFGEEQTKNIQIVKNVLNEEPGYYIVIAVHNSVEKRDDFVTKVVASGEKNINFFFDVNTNKYFIYYEKFNSINQAKNALSQKGSKPYNAKMSLVKIDN